MFFLTKFSIEELEKFFQLDSKAFIWRFSRKTVWFCCYFWCRSREFHREFVYYGGVLMFWYFTHPAPDSRYFSEEKCWFSVTIDFVQIVENFMLRTAIEIVAFSSSNSCSKSKWVFYAFILVFYINFWVDYFYFQLAKILME